MSSRCNVRGMIAVTAAAMVNVSNVQAASPVPPPPPVAPESNACTKAKEELQLAKQAKAKFEAAEQNVKNLKSELEAAEVKYSALYSELTDPTYDQTAKQAELNQMNDDCNSAAALYDAAKQKYENADKQTEAGQKALEEMIASQAAKQRSESKRDLLLNELKIKENIDKFNTVEREVVDAQNGLSAAHKIHNLDNPVVISAKNRLQLALEARRTTHEATKPDVLMANENLKTAINELEKEKINLSNMVSGNKQIKETTLDPTLIFQEFADWACDSKYTELAETYIAKKSIKDLATELYLANIKIRNANRSLQDAKDSLQRWQNEVKTPTDFNIYDVATINVDSLTKNIKEKTKEKTVVDEERINKFEPNAERAHKLLESDNLLENPKFNGSLVNALKEADGEASDRQRAKIEKKSVSQTRNERKKHVPRHLRRLESPTPESPTPKSTAPKTDPSNFSLEERVARVYEKALENANSNGTTQLAELEELCKATETERKQWCVNNKKSKLIAENNRSGDPEIDVVEQCKLEPHYYRRMVNAK